MDKHPDERRHEKSCTAQRVRVGVTGLGAIFLVVMVAAAGMRPARSVAPPDSQGETLAVLGVAPNSGSAALHDDAGRTSSPRLKPPRPSAASPTS